MRTRLLFHSALSALVPVLALTLSGCGVVPQVPTSTEAMVPITGSVHGGQQPVAGAVVTLYVAGATGYGSAPTALSTTATLADGSFQLPAHAPCPTPDRLIYLQAVGGNPGLPGVNTTINEIAILGNCSTATSSRFVIVNEATTIAAAYALAPFVSFSGPLTNIGTSASNILGLNNAAAPAQTLVNDLGGVNASNPAAGLVLPTRVVGTLADVLAACVNSSGATSSSCTTLFSATTVNGVAPVDTLQAAFNIALHPGANVSMLFGLVTPSAPFQPTIAATTPPNDFSLAIGYNGGGIAARGVNAVAIDATGNAWVTDYYTNTAGTVTGLIEITPTGQYPGGATGFGNGQLGPMNNLAIDQVGSIWVAVNGGAPAIVQVAPNGSVAQTFPNAVSPNGIAIDSAMNVWYSAGGNPYNVTNEIKYQGNSTYTAVTGFTDATHFGVDVCIAGGYVYTVSIGNTSESAYVTQFNAAGNAGSIGTTASVAPDSGFAGLAGCAVDQAGNVWLNDYGNFNGVRVYSPALTLLKSFAIAGRIYPQEVALDGLGNVFVATYIPQGNTSYSTGTSNPASLVEFTNSGTLVSPAIGYIPTTGQSSTFYTGLEGLTSQVIAPGGVAIDASGNVWLSGNDGQSVPSTGNVNTGNLPAYVTEVIGIAAPVVTPKSVALTTGRITTRP